MVTFENFAKIEVTGDRKIHLIGTSGSVYLSEDYGNSWNRVRQPDNLYLTDLYLLDNERAWISTQKGIVLTTSNGGRNWNINEAADSTFKINAMWFTDENNGYIAGGEPDGSGFIYKTVDGGHSWSKIALPAKEVLDIMFLDSKNGFGIFQEKVFRTNDEGKTWREVGNAANLKFRRLFFFDNFFGWAAGSEEGLYVTRDGGKTWKPSPAAETRKINDIYFYDRIHGWAVGDNGAFLYTENGGESWISLETGVIDDFASVRFSNPHSGFICGDNGILIKVEYEQ